MTQIEKLRKFIELGVTDHYYASRGDKRVTVNLVELRDEIERLQARERELSEAVKALLEVEYTSDMNEEDSCPWCGWYEGGHSSHRDPYINEPDKDDGTWNIGHAQDCPRQRAKALIETV